MAQTRIVVMNGQRLTQEAKTAGDWQVAKVDKAGAIRPGVYNLVNAKAAEASVTYTGAIVHQSGLEVYQQSQVGLVKHVLPNGTRLPDPGTVKSIAYGSTKKPTITDLAAKDQTKKRTRTV